MKRIIPLSLVAVASLYAAEVQLDTIGVESTVITEVAANAQVSADIAEALTVKVPSIDMSRRSGIANDIFIRGQKRDNISVEVDGTKTCGACVNRMDPPISHVLASQIEEIEVIEGPYDVETFGTMSGGVKIKTKKPSKDFMGEVNLGFGSWGYQKFGATLSGGNDLVRVLISGSTERSEQYEDGNGDTIAGQIDKYIEENPAAAGTAFGDDYKDMDSYTKKSIMVKAFVTITDDQELRLSYTGNQSDNVLYGTSKMDAIYDDSNIYSIEYNINNVTDIYKNINLQYYKSDVDHPMGTNYRVSGAVNYMTNWLTTDMEGIKLKNNFDLNGYDLLVGLDASERKWDGHYLKNDNPNYLPGGAGRKSIDNSITKNRAIFTKVEKTFGALSLTAGARYDSTKITHATLETNKYKALGANLFLSYNLDKQNRIFAGIGQAYRVPDARELSFTGSAGNLSGTPDLDQTRNREIDLGYELTTDMFNVKLKTFYSDLKDYIYIEKGVMTNAFQNIDATIYGAELSASYFATDDITIDMGASYKRGKKDEALEGQSDRDLADMAPIRGNIALSYEYMNDSIVTADVQASRKWNNIDEDNGEQELDSWAILNLKVKHAINKQFIFTLGMNNVFDKTYAVNNTYADLILITAGGTSDVMLMNEPGRYVYTNMTFKF